MAYRLEICVDSLESARRAEEAGADRLELCADLLVGGTSPSPFFIRQVMQNVHIPVNVLLRPRFGDFCFTDSEKQVLLDEIDFCRECGVNAVVIGRMAIWTKLFCRNVCSMLERCTKLCTAVLMCARMHLLHWNRRSP